MLNITENEPIVFAGDWHGSLRQAQNVVAATTALDSRVIMHVGDFGVWDRDERFTRKLNKLLVERQITLYFVDGNHENFDLLYKYPLIEDGTRQIHSNIFHLPRGYRWEWAGVTFMGMGGAASIDFGRREIGKSWWKEELLSDEDISNGLLGGYVDVMVCHDSPSNAPNSICDDSLGQLAALSYFGPGLVYATEHRKRLQEVTDTVTPRIIYHGHYHQAMEGAFIYPDGTFGSVIGLDQGLAHLSNHIRAISPKELREKRDAIVKMTAVEDYWK